MVATVGGAFAEPCAARPIVFEVSLELKKMKIQSASSLVVDQREVDR
jgi:hypothetical protein